MVWDVSPIAFVLHLGSFTLPLHWYGLLFAGTFAYGTILFRWLYRREGFEADQAYDLVLSVIAGTVIGARLGHVLVYDPGYYLANPLKILAVWEGGLASHGAVIGILTAVWLLSLRPGNPSFVWICDRIGMAVPFSGFLIRLGNFFNSEILGRPTEVPWAVVFARVDALPRHPAQLYEALAYLLIFIWQFRYYRLHGKECTPGELFGRFFLLVFGARFLVEFFKEEQTAYVTTGLLTTGQWLSIPAMLCGLALIGWSRHKAGRFC